MQSASALPTRYNIGKTLFYQRRDYLIKLGYNMESVKDGRNRFYSDEQVQFLDELDAHIKNTGGMEGFPTAVIEQEKNPAENHDKLSSVHKTGELVHRDSEQIENSSAESDEIYVDTNPLADIKEQQLASVDLAAQYAAAQNLTAFNYLTVDYMKHRDFSVPGLAESVQKSEQVVKQTFTSMMESPSSTTKKMMERLKQRRSKQTVQPG